MKKVDKIMKAEKQIQKNETKLSRASQFFGKEFGKMDNINNTIINGHINIDTIQRQKLKDQEENVVDSDKSSSLGSYGDKDPEYKSNLYQNQVSLDFDEDSDEELKKIKAKIGRKTTANNQTSNITEK